MNVTPLVFRSSHVQITYFGYSVDIYGDMGTITIKFAHKPSVGFYLSIREDGFVYLTYKFPSDTFSSPIPLGYIHPTLSDSNVVFPSYNLEGFLAYLVFIISTKET
jgi:hypothetical protein